MSFPLHSSVLFLGQLVYDVYMATLKKMREELSLAGRQGYTAKIRSISGIDGTPKDATEVIILYLALEEIRGNKLAGFACTTLKEYWGTTHNGE